MSASHYVSRAGENTTENVKRVDTHCWPQANLSAYMTCANNTVIAGSEPTEGQDVTQQERNGQSQLPVNAAT